MPTKAVIFDMDGVMIKSEPIWSKLERVFLSRRGIPYNDEYKTRFMGHSQRDVVAAIKEEHSIQGSIEELVGERVRIMKELFDRELELSPGLATLLARLQRAGTPLALATSSPAALMEYVLDRFALRSYFAAAIAGDMVARAKPAPDIYLLAANRLSVAPQSCVVIEDSPAGVAAAKAAGMRCIAMPDPTYVQNGFESADAVVKSLLEVPTVLETIP